jgi:hypothetical protein
VIVFRCEKLILYVVSETESVSICSIEPVREGVWITLSQEGGRRERRPCTLDRCWRYNALWVSASSLCSGGFVTVHFSELGV